MHLLAVRTLKIRIFDDRDGRIRITADVIVSARRGGCSQLSFRSCQKEGCERWKRKAPFIRRLHRENTARKPSKKSRRLNRSLCNLPSSTHPLTLQQGNTTDEIGLDGLFGGSSNSARRMSFAGHRAVWRGPVPSALAAALPRHTR